MTEKETFIIEFKKLNFNILQTCKKIGISKGKYKYWMKKDPDFASIIQNLKLIQPPITPMIITESINKKNDVIIQEEKDTTDKEIVEIINWCEAMGNRMTTNDWELSRVINWYKKIFGNEPDNRECMSCLVSVVRALQLWSKEHKAQYIK